MKLNDFSTHVLINNNKQSDLDGYVQLDNDQKYKLQLKNNGSKRCNAKVTIDGESVGVFRINSHSSIIIERPADIAKKFTFYLVDSTEGKSAGLKKGVATNVVIKVVFSPELTAHNSWVNPIYTMDADMRGCYSGKFLGAPKRTKNLHQKSKSKSFCSYNTCSTTSLSEGGTGLQGHSGQTFHDASSMKIDTNNTTTIYLRLVGSSTKEDANIITPLSSKHVSTPNSCTN